MKWILAVSRAPFSRSFGIALDTSWHIYPHRTDSGIICHSFSQHFRRAPTASKLDLFRERFLILLESEWPADPRNFAAIAGATRAFTRIAQRHNYALARDRRMARICAVQA
jgi:hypothetical protein